MDRQNATSIKELLEMLQSTVTEIDRMIRYSNNTLELMGLLGYSTWIATSIKARMDILTMSNRRTDD
jgi:hypothetical protein